jgi:hypothetical protein
MAASNSEKLDSQDITSAHFALCPVYQRQANLLIRNEQWLLADDSLPILISNFRERGRDHSRRKFALYSGKIFLTYRLL